MPEEKAGSLEETERVYEVPMLVSLPLDDFAEMIVRSCDESDIGASFWGLVERIDELVGTWDFTLVVTAKMMEHLLVFADEESDQSLQKVLRDALYVIREHPLYDEP